jgi:outer membrane protein assembly factor BamB
VIYQNLVILNCGPGERQFLLALDKKTGKEVWKVDEPGGNAGANSNDWSGSWSTPVITRLDGKDILLMSWPGVLRAMDPRSGSELWSCKGLSKLVYTSPLPSPEAVVAMCGYGGAWMGVRPGGSGEVTESHRLWRVERAQQRIGSGVIIGEHVYMVNEPGTAECIELKTGKVIWSERLGGSTWGSVLHADGKLFATSRRGETFVFAAKPQFELLGRNALDETTLSSPILSNGEILIRTYQHLWCIAPGR